MPVNNAVTRWLARKIATRARRLMARRPPDFVIGTSAEPYLNRWYCLPRNHVFNVYLHEFMSDDDDRAPHCHPWMSVSLALSGPMREVYLDRRYGMVVERRRFVKIGDLLPRGARFAHRMIVDKPGSLTLFITGPRIRSWYFWCDNVRPVHWKQFVGSRIDGQTGRGCE